MTTLCISLGHNSSALYINDYDKPVGYEEERLSKNKSDSRFPVASILQIKTVIGEQKFESIRHVWISHWFDKFDPYATENKYYSALQTRSLFPNAVILAVNKNGFTHHLAHAYSSLAFYDHASPNNRVFEKRVVAAVIDGFGNGQEVASVYELDAKTNTLQTVRKICAYEQSLGLLYQYAATAVGMDGINDVYKFLGYRTHVTGFDVFRCNPVIERILGHFQIYFMANMNQVMGANYSTTQLIDYDDLEGVKTLFESFFEPLIDSNEFASRCRVGFAVQEVLERCTLAFLSSVEFDVLLLSGGCFYNVRLNDAIRREFPDAEICIMPVAGDQGAALGMYYGFMRKPINFHNLCFGVRSELEALAMLDEQERVDAIRGIRIVADDEDAIDSIAGWIAYGVIVNIMHGSMEFGPRALCRTSSLALCRKDLVEAINTANGRNTVMPMAPAMLEENAALFFDDGDLSRTIASDRFMITAHNYLHDAQGHGDLSGAMHKDLDETWSGRPQLVTPNDNLFMYKLLKRLQDQHGVYAVINTSLNLHGEPIIYSIDDFANLHSAWQELCPTAKFQSYIVLEA